MKAVLLTTVLLVLFAVIIQGDDQSFLDLISRATCVDGKYCTPDCTGIRICTGGTAYDVSCKIQTNGTRLFCNDETKTCDSDPEKCAVIGEKDCPLGAGTFPDVKNCKKYYVCDAKNYRINYDCAGISVYDPAVQDCKVGTTCYDFTLNGVCKGSVPRLIAHPLYKHFYVICTDGYPILQVCPYNEYYQFNSTTTKCSFVCGKNGKFADMEDKDKVWYFACLWDGKQFIQDHKRCEPGNTFDPTTQVCKH